MGIERFFKSINSIYSNEIIRNINVNNNITHFYFDFNSIIHKVSNNIANKLNDLLLYSLIYKYSDKSYMDKDILVTEYAHTNKFFEFEFTVQNFYENVKNVNLVDIVIKHIIDDIKTYLSFYPACKFLYIAIDGVPSVGKMIEQQDRRYKGYIMGAIQNKLREKYYQQLNIKNFNNNLYNELEYMELKFSFDKNTISPETKFMVKLVNILNNYDFKFKTIISDFNEPGEGEKKIIKHIKKELTQSDKIIIYSPDADMIIMTMILPNFIYILRHEQADSTDAIIDIQSIRKFFSPVNDIAYIFSVFGDDFIPKIEWVNVTKHLKSIIIEYKKLNIRIIENNKVNLINLQKFFRAIQKLEHSYTPTKNPFNHSIEVMNKDTFNYYNELNNIEKLIRNYQPRYNEIADDIPPLEYYKAMLWKFNYYFLDDESNNDYYYKYSYAPSIEALVKFSNFQQIVLNYKTTKITPMEQLIFISPINVSVYTNDKTEKLLADKLYKLMKVQLPEIKLNKDRKINVDEIFECHNARYLNKCHLKFNIINFEKYKTFLL